MLFGIAVKDGLSAIEDSHFVEAIASLWARAYRDSPILSQSQDALYQDTAMAQSKRVGIIHSELRCASSVIVYAMLENTITGFFWALPVHKLEKKKLSDIEAFIASSSMGKSAYLSMLGVDNQFKGNKLGEKLTHTLCDVLKEKGFSQVIARTINIHALEKIYKKQGFEIYTQQLDSAVSPPTIRYIFGKNL